MMIEITSSGGFAGLPSVGAEKKIDVATQEDTQRQAICSAFDPKVLQVFAAAPLHQGAADMMTYHITITDVQNQQHSFDLREDQLPPETLDLIDMM